MFLKHLSFCLIWNLSSYKKAFYHFGAPIFSQQEFLGNQFDVWGIGIEPNRIEVLNKIKGVEFSEAYPLCKTFIQNNIEIKYIHLNHLLLAKAAAGRYKDKADIEELKKRNTKL
jgi:hypothetical protein